MSLLCRLIRRFVAGVLLLQLFWAQHAAFGLTAADFKTQEYYSSTGLQYINAAAAYALGYTGLGITVGIIDTPVLASHPELSGKVLGSLLPAGYPPVDWSSEDHGTHVAGIMVAKSNGVGMEGVAFDADLYAVTIDLRGGPTVLASPDLLSYFAALPAVKIINNSWGTAVFPYESGDNVATVFSQLYNTTDTRYLMALATAYDKVIVFSAGNDGHASPAFEAIAPRYVPDLKGWLNVVSMDTSAITWDAGGNKIGDVQVVSVFSNLSQGAALFSVTAPGSNIYSLEASGTGTGYTLKSGTSMAAPYVSGALALVQQAFPWMTGKQLADAVLTTADNPSNNRFDPPDYIITVAETSVNATTTKYRVLIHYIDTAVPASATILSNLQTYYTKNAAGLRNYAIYSYADFLDAYYGTYSFTSNGVAYSFDQIGLATSETFGDVFGQGILNVGLAVRGPAILDANRLSSTDYSAAYGCALYSVNTRGYTGVFSNDISQRQWDNTLHHRTYQYLAGDDATDPLKADAVALLSQNVGLLKDGEGTLILTGYNTYAGTTVVRGGTLSINRVSGVALSGTLVSSNVAVESAGLLTGDGQVNGTVFNAGAFIPGSGLGSFFTVGTYTQQTAGLLALLLDSDGAHNSLRTTQTNLNGGTVGLLAIQDYYPNKSMTFAFSDFISGTVSTSGFNWQTDLVAGLYNTSVSDPLDWTSPTLDVSASVAQVGAATPTTLTVTFSRAANAYSRYAVSANAGRVGAVFDQTAGAVVGDAQNLVESLDFSAANGSDVSSALSQLSPRQYAASASASRAVQRSLNSTLLARMFGGTARSMQFLASANKGPVDPWSVVLLPLGGLGHADAGQGLATSSVNWSGVAAGLETDRITDTGAWHVGGHMTFIRTAQNSGGPGDNRAVTDGAYLSGQFRFVPHDLNQPNWAMHTFGQVRVGMESTTQHRGVLFNGYAREAASQWVMPVGSALLGAGFDYTPRIMGSRLVLGPVAWLDYNAAWRPPVTEHDGMATNLKLESGMTQSLRSSLGARLGAWIPALGRPDAIQADFMAVWNHELLRDNGRIRARFADFGSSFSYIDEITARDSLGLSAGLTAKCGAHLGIGLTGGTELARDRNTAWGSVNVAWTF
ncbi:MAG: S8 family serine peptidase [Solidesulfovibrio sp.]